LPDSTSRPTIALLIIIAVLLAGEFESPSSLCRFVYRFPARPSQYLSLWLPEPYRVNFVRRLPSPPSPLRQQCYVHRQQPSRLISHSIRCKAPSPIPELGKASCLGRRSASIAVARRPSFLQGADTPARQSSSRFPPRAAPPATIVPAPTPGTAIVCAADEGPALLSIPYIHAYTTPGGWPVCDAPWSPIICTQYDTIPLPSPRGPCSDLTALVVVQSG
jgi:hypothetical protein